MVQTVTIEKSDKSFRVHFAYNTDLVDIMREFNGWWYRKYKAWQFPIKKFDEIYDRLTNEHYNVTMIKPKSYKQNSPKPQTTIDRFSNPDVISYYSTCKKCNQKNFVGKDGLCSRCRFGE